MSNTIKVIEAATRALASSPAGEPGMDRYIDNWSRAISSATDHLVRGIIRTYPNGMSKIAMLEDGKIVGTYHDVLSAEQIEGMARVVEGPVEGRPLSSDDLRRIGEALFGERWQSDLARALSVNDRRVREWVAGTRSPPLGIRAEIAALCAQRGQQLLSYATHL